VTDGARRRLRRRWLAIGATLLGVLAVGGVAVYRAVVPYRGYLTAEQFVEVPQGSTVREIERRLVDAGVVQDPAAFRLAFRMRSRGRTLKAGEYRFTDPLPAVEVVDRIARGDVYLRPLTFPEGLTIREMAALFQSKGFGPADAFTRAAADASLVKDLDAAAVDLEGYLFPETYALPRRADARALVREMVQRFRKAYDTNWQRVATERGLTTRQAVTLASLVEKETGRPEERPLVSAVYTNRLRVGMGLQCDPSVIYALTKAGLYDGNLTRENLRFDSPYNTYRYAGLPPGPIAAPGKASLEAALRPAPGDYRYFVSRNDGSHAFAATLVEHNRNVARYQKQRRPVLSPPKQG
jgi:UPF0755 protein